MLKKLFSSLRLCYKSFKTSLVLLIFICFVLLLMSSRYQVQISNRLSLEIENVTTSLISYDPICKCRPMIKKNFSNLTVQSTCSEFSESRGFGQKIISYALYGDFKSSYFRGIQENLEGIEKFYPPDFVMRLYFDSNKKEDLQKLCQIFCNNSKLDICNTHKAGGLGNISNSNGMIWRFAPMADPLVDEWHSRDLDSRISLRETEAVKEFRESKASFHIMRDNRYHGTSILGGMWGTKPMSKNDRLIMKQDFMDMFKNSRRNNVKGQDQGLLSRFVWRSCNKDNTLIHDSYLCKILNHLKNTKPFPTKRLSGPNNFVGANGGEITLKNHGECPKECRPPNHLDWILC